MTGGPGKGRVTGSRNRRTLETLALLEDGESPCQFAIRIMRDETQALDLRIHAAKMAAPYLHPRPQPEPRVVAFDLPEQLATSADLMAAHTLLLKAAASGEVSLDEAKDVSAMLDAHRKVIETANLEERIAKLEQLQGRKQ